MKIAVFSDTHGSARGMLSAVRAYEPDAIIHLGDGNSDIAKLEREFPDLPVYAVCGNCDWENSAPESLSVDLGGVTAFLTHGHRYGVRYGNLDKLLYAAECSGAKIAMFGHTHRAGFEDVEGIFVLNPGTAGVGGEKTWAELEIGADGKITCSIEKVVLS